MERDISRKREVNRESEGEGEIKLLRDKATGKERRLEEKEWK